jgi:hypothetical protein
MLRRALKVLPSIRSFHVAQITRLFAFPKVFVEVDHRHVPENPRAHFRVRVSFRAC